LINDVFPYQLYVNEVVLGTVFGIIIGPFVSNIFAPRSWGSLNNTITLEVTRIVLVIGLFAAGVELPRAYMKTHAKSLLVMVVPTMAFGWVVVAGNSSHMQLPTH
jgi:NhaP-type Na+/H+ or K+/H+ antiporter